MEIQIRKFEEEDAEATEQILRAAFGRTESMQAELRRNRKTTPEAWFIAEVEGERVGMVGAVNYATFAYIGMMVVHPAYQRRGIGRKLMERLLDWLQAHQIEMSLLDATEFGEPLYARLGFMEDDRVHIYHQVYEKQYSEFPEGVRPVREKDLPAVHTLDRAVYGGDRSVVLDAFFHDYPKRAFLATEGESIRGFLFAQEKRIGPWIATDLPAADGLLQAALSLPYENPAGILIPHLNEEGRGLLERAGFEEIRSLSHMRRGGAEPPARRTSIFGLGNFTVG